MQLGLERGDAACVVIGRCPDWHKVLLGCMKAGVISMPGTTLLTAKDIAYRVNQAGAKAVIVSPEHCEKVDKIVSECPTLEHLIVAGKCPSSRWLALSDLKAAHGTQLNPSDLQPFSSGVTTVLYDAPGMDVDAHFNLIKELNVTTFCAPPTVYRLFAQQDLSRYDLSSLRRCLGAGEPLNPEVIRYWEEHTGTTIADGYGQTETINIVGNFPGIETRFGSMGKAVPGFDVNVVDDAGSVLSDNEVGHIAVNTSGKWPIGLFQGYLRDGELVTAAFKHGWYYTGDTAYRDADGYLWFVGRSDDLISSAGYRISPFEVESALLEHEQVAESAVIGVPDETRGQLVKAFIVLSKGSSPSDELAQEIQVFCKDLTAPYKYPRIVEFVDSLPKTISGKIRRVELREES